MMFVTDNQFTTRADSTRWFAKAKVSWDYRVVTKLIPGQPNMEIIFVIVVNESFGNYKVSFETFSNLFFNKPYFDIRFKKCGNTVQRK